MKSLINFESVVKAEKKGKREAFEIQNIPRLFLRREQQTVYGLITKPLIF